MFTFRRIIQKQAGWGWIDQLFYNSVLVGTLELDEKGLHLKSNKSFTLKEIAQLTERVTSRDSELLYQTIEFLPYGL
jgi:hypothetical protein